MALATERILRPVQGMHRSIAKPWFEALGGLGAPTRVAHDLISDVVYGSIQVAASALGSVLDARQDGASPSADAARALVNGLWGDSLGRYGPRLDTAVSLRDAHGAAVDALEVATLPNATPRLAVLVHGLIETERCWGGSETAPGLLPTLEGHEALTPVLIRYNSGRSIASNGMQLASLLQQVSDHWPHPVESIALVGHSMGGLVIRSAYAAARSAGHSWTEAVSDIVTIGSPHLGSPMEKLVRVATRGLALTPQTRPLADFLDSRSQGIRDLGFGDIGFADHAGADSMPGVKHHFIAGVITGDPSHRVGALIGDWMVRPASGTGAPTAHPANVAVLGGVHHFDLLDQPAVVERVMSWLAPAS